MRIRAGICGQAEDFRDAYGTAWFFGYNQWAGRSGHVSGESACQVFGPFLAGYWAIITCSKAPIYFYLKCDRIFTPIRSRLVNAFGHDEYDG